MSRPLQSAFPWHSTLAQLRLALAANLRLHALTLIALTSVGFALRLGLLHTFPLREDEAIYGYWARAAITDPFFIHVWPDKPPLFIWLLTTIFALVGPSEASARLVSIFASTLTIPIIALSAQRLWQSHAAALMAAFLLTFNPYAVSFSPTAYTDSLLVLFGSGAILCALMGRGLAAGLLLGAACMTKQQGLLYVPLIVALLVLSPSWKSETSRRVAKLGMALLGVALVVLPILWWDSQRWAVAPSPWELAQRTYAPLTLVPMQDWWDRAAAWWGLVWYLGGNWVVWTMLIAALLVAPLLTTGIIHKRHSIKWLLSPRRGLSANRQIRRDAYGMTTRGIRSHLSLALLLGWGFAFLLTHTITTMQVWDRYLLPLAPWLALVASGPLIKPFFARGADWLRNLLIVLLLAGLVEVATLGMQAARGEMPIGGDHGDYAGLTQAIEWVQTQGDSTGPAILYHQVLGWHFRFYLYDETQAIGNVPPRFDLRWFPSAAYLADNAAKSPYPRKYLIVPDWATPRDLALHLALRGLAMEVRTRTDRFAVIEIVQPTRPWCDWCQSTLAPTEEATPFAPKIIDAHVILPQSNP